MTNWQPISTAPKDGTPFLTFSADAHREQHVNALDYPGTTMLVMRCEMFGDELVCVDEHGDWHDIACYDATHWAPLPKPPVD